MPRVSDVLVVLTYAMIAVVASLALERFGLLSSGLAWIMGAVVFLIAGQVHAAAARAEERRTLARDLHELRAANMSLLEELEQVQTRLETVETGTGPQRAGAAASRHEDGDDAEEAYELSDAVEGVEGYSIPASAARAQNPQDERLIADLMSRLERAGQSTAANLTDAADPDIVRAALDANRIDLYLQPVVSLPQRRTYFYEGFSRLRDEKGEVLAPAAFLQAAEDANLITDLDNLMLFRCVQIIRRLTKSDRRIGIFCNVSLRSIADEEFFPAFLDFLRRNSDLAGSLIFEMTQAAFEGRSATAARNMARLADYGFRFSIDQVSNLSMDLAELQRAGVRFAKVEGRRLVDAAHGAEPIAGREPGAIASEDIAGLFARYGVDLVAEKIETESTVVEVLDLDVGYAQGHLFGAPRPVREDVIAETDYASAGHRRAG